MNDVDNENDSGRKHLISYEINFLYFRVGESKFRVGAAHPAHPLDKTLDSAWSIAYGQLCLNPKAIFNLVTFPRE